MTPKEKIAAGRLHEKQIELLFTQASLGLIGTAVSAAVFALVSWPYVRQQNLLIWLVSVLCLTLLRYALVVAYRRAPNRARPSHWGMWFTVGSGLSGTLWGLANIVLFPTGSLAHQAFLVLLIGMLAAGTLAIYASVLAASLIFVVPSLAPVTVQFYLRGDNLHLAIASMMLLYMAILVVSSRRMHQTIVQSLSMNLENSDLVSYLSTVNEQTEALNEKLTAEITERKKAVAASQESEERFRILSEASFEGIVIHENGVIIDANEKFAEMLGYEPGEMLGMTVFDLADPVSHRIIRERLATKRHDTSELWLRRCDGASFPVEIQAKNLPYRGKMVRVVAARDITERKAALEKLKTSEARLASILNNVQDTLYRSNTRGEVTWCSSSVRNVLGYTPEELLGTKLSNLYLEPDGRLKFLKALDDAGGTITNYEAPFVRKDGEIIWLSTNAHYYYDEFGNILGVEGATRDISVLKRAQDALVQEKERLLVTLESIGDGVITTDTADRIEYLNPVAEQLTGWTNAQALGRPVGDVFNVFDEATQKPVADLLEGLESTELQSDTYRPVTLRRHDGSEFSVVHTASRIRDNENRNIGTVLVVRDITEIRRMELTLAHQATHDALTQLINRYEFETRLKGLLEDARENGTQHVLCYLDLDQFKIVNDTCGHIAGDELLKQLTGRLQTQIMSSDTLARLGGDEFGVLLEDCSVSEGQYVANELRQAIRDFRFAWQGRIFELGVSIGLVPVTAASGNIVDTLSAADSACYLAKDQGGNRVHVYQSDDKALAHRHGEMQWLQRIQKALEDNRFALYAQTAVPITGDEARPAYREILLRMIGEHGELIAPTSFIPAAERYHVMPEIDRWVLRATLERLEQRDHEIGNPADQIIAINLSGQSLCQDGFLDFVVELLTRYRMPLETLCFEVTETAAIANLSHATHFITTLQKMGCRFALDDFGSGLSSFGYLRRLPVDFLKIDGSFVRDMVDDPIDRAMVHTIHQIGRLMNKQTIAEFVEHEAILAELKKLGVSYAQGSYIEKPHAFNLEPELERQSL